MKRVRLVTVTLHVEAVVDDGDTLAPIRIDPVKLTAAELARFDIAAELAQVEATINAE